MKSKVFVLILSGIFIQCKQADEYIHPEKRTLVEAVYASGKIIAKDQYQVFASIAGIIDSIFVKEGDTLDLNAPLFSIQNENAGLNTQIAELNLQNLEQELSAQKGKLYELRLQVEATKNKYEYDSTLLVKQERLLKQNIGSQLSVEQQKLALDQSYKSWKTALSAYSIAQSQLNNELKKAKNQVRILSNTSGDLVVKSATQGKLYFLNKKTGEMVAPQEPVALIGNAKDFIIELQVDEQDISKIKLGQRVLVSLESYANEVFEAQVSNITPYMKEANKSFEVEAVFLKKPEILYPFLSLEANIVISEFQEALCIPKSILLADNKVVLANGDTVSITTGIQNMEWIQVLEGLEPSSQLMKP